MPPKESPRILKKNESQKKKPSFEKIKTSINKAIIYALMGILPQTVVFSGKDKDSDHIKNKKGKNEKITEQQKYLTDFIDDYKEVEFFLDGTISELTENISDNFRGDSIPKNTTSSQILSENIRRIRDQNEDLPDSSKTKIGFHYFSPFFGSFLFQAPTTEGYEIYDKINDYLDKKRRENIAYDHPSLKNYDKIVYESLLNSLEKTEKKKEKTAWIFVPGHLNFSDTLSQKELPKIIKKAKEKNVEIFFLFIHPLLEAHKARIITLEELKNFLHKNLKEEIKKEWIEEKIYKRNNEDKESSPKFLTPKELQKLDQDFNSFIKRKFDLDLYYGKIGKEYYFIPQKMFSK